MQALFTCLFPSLTMTLIFPHWLLCSVKYALNASTNTLSDLEQKL